MAGQIEIRLESMDVQESLECYRHKGSFNKYVDKKRGLEGQLKFHLGSRNNSQGKMSIFVHSRGWGSKLGKIWST